MSHAADTLPNTPVSLALRPSARLEWKDYLGLFFLVVALYVAAVLKSRTGPFWSDEMIGFLVLHQPTLERTLLLWRNGLDSSGFWYEIVGRFWVRVFGLSELSLRLYSATAVAGAAAALWAAARRLYSFPVVAACVAYLFANSVTLRWQLGNARTYGLLLFAVALVFYFVIRSSEDDQSEPSVPLLCGVFAANVLLAGSHILGPVYVAVCLAGLVASDLYLHRFRLKLYLAALCSEVMLLVDWPNIQATLAVGKPSFWTVPPRYIDFVRLKWILDSRVSALMVLLVVLAVIMRRFRLHRRHAPVYFLAAAFACLGICIFVYSRIGTSIYVDRYLLPFSLAGGLVFCEVTSMLVDTPGRESVVRWAAPLVIAGLAVAGFFLPRLQRGSLPYPESWPGLKAELPPNMPIVCPDIATFLVVEFFHHNPDGRQILFPTDWAVALDRETTGGVSGYHEIDNLKRFDIYGEDIQPSAEILNSHDEFAVISAVPNVWLKRRLLADPRFKVESYSSHSAMVDGHAVEVYTVHRVTPAP